MKVSIELEDEECAGIVVKRRLTGFDVDESQGGRWSRPFRYCVVAKGKGSEDRRLDCCAATETDSYPIAELREKG